MNNHKIYFQIVRTYQIIFTRLYFNYFLMDKFTSILPNRSNFKLNQIIFTRLYFNYFVMEFTSILPNRLNFKLNQIIFTRLYFNYFVTGNYKIYFHLTFTQSFQTKLNSFHTIILQLFSDE